MRIRLIILALIFVMLSAGCQVFPYVTPPASDTMDISPAAPIVTEAAPNQTPSETTASTASPDSGEPAQSESEDDPVLTSLLMTMQANSLTYILQDGNPIYLPNFAQSSVGCAWMGVAGQIFSEDNQPIKDLMIIAGKAGEGQQFSAVSGQATAYGIGGYEIQLGTDPVTTQGVYWVQLSDLAGQPLSHQIYFDTNQDCQKNLILINFVEFLSPLTDGEDIRSPKTQPLGEESAYP